MTTQKGRADEFARLHIKGEPLILFNIWDAGSAKAVQDAGAKAIATGSWSVAAANGFDDGENVSLDVSLDNLKRIATAVDLPVTLDLEGGYATDLGELQDNISKVIDAGAVGINFEDQVVGREGLYSIEEQADRIRAIREATSIPLFINARTDVFLKTYPAEHTEDQLEDVLRRAAEYAKAGASGLFAPGLRDKNFIKKLCDDSAIPVNIMVLPDTPPAKDLAALGVARISHGPGPYRQMMEALTEAARKTFSEL